jgi:glycosyltransferase involved in cell wall biosynthesis
LWTHGWYGNEGVIKSLIKTLFFNLSDGIFLYGDYAKNIMLEKGFREDKLHVLYNSLDYLEQIKYRIKQQPLNFYKGYFSNDFPVLIFIGRLTKSKKLDLLIDANEKLIRSGVNINIMIVGDGEEKSFLTHKVNQQGLSNTYFFGSTFDDEKISQLISNATICVSPGNVGLTAIHSLMYGTPVITHSDFKNQMPEFEAIEPMETGDFFENDNVDSLVSTIKNWLNVKTDREAIKDSCFKKIDTKYNPLIQLQAMKKVFDC